MFIIAIAAMLFVTESALNVWDRLVQGPRIILYGYLAVMVLLVSSALWLVFRLLVRRKISTVSVSDKKLRKADIEERLQDAEQSGVDVGAGVVAVSGDLGVLALRVDIATFDGLRQVAVAIAIVVDVVGARLACLTNEVVRHRAVVVEHPRAAG